MQRDKAKLSIASAVELAIELAGGKSPVRTVKLTAADIDQLIARLVQFRAMMTPEIERTPPDPVTTRPLIDPMWALRIPAADRDKLLMLRHPGLGWLMFLLPPREAAKLAHALLSDGHQQVAEERLPKSPLH